MWSRRKQEPSKPKGTLLAALEVAEPGEAKQDMVNGTEENEAKGK
jgi:hypothetical protein